MADVNLSELSRFTGIPVMTLSKWGSQNGMPVKRAVNKVLIDSSIAIKWIIQWHVQLDRKAYKSAPRTDTDTESGVDPREEARRSKSARLRKEEADAAIKEVELNVLAGRFVAVQDTTRVNELLMSNVRVRMLGLAAKIAPRLGMKPVDVVRKAVDQAVREALEELAKTDVKELTASLTGVDFVTSGGNGNGNSGGDGDGDDT